MTERALLVARTGEVAALPGPESLIEPLVELYVRTIYGHMEHDRPVGPA